MKLLIINFFDKIIDGLTASLCILLSILLFIISLPFFVVCLVLLPIFILLGIFIDAFGAD